MINELSHLPYPIIFSDPSFSSLENHPGLNYPQTCIITDTHVAPKYLNSLQTQLNGKSIEPYIIPAGEVSKSLTTVEKIIDHLAQQKFHRGGLLLALGGGVVGDITGFVASCFQRGTPYIQVPTTLIAQIDSSIGGKTGVNHHASKNLIGSFYSPSAIFIDVNTLQTLPNREYYSGIAEVIKTALICDEFFFRWLEENLDLLINKEPSVILNVIKKCCALKSKIVSADPLDTGGRMHLNFGHSFGHALETEIGYGKLLHGEAVSIGMCLASQISCELGFILKQDVNRIFNLLTRANLPTKLPAAIKVSSLIERMAHDKKMDSSGLKLVLLKRIGESFLKSSVSEKDLHFLFSQILL